MASKQEIKDALRALGKCHVCGHIHSRQDMETWPPDPVMATLLKDPPSKPALICDDGRCHSAACAWGYQPPAD